MEIKYHQTFNQFWRFSATGFLNALIDYGVLLILSFATGITSGNGIIPLNIISFGLATTNSYFFNKNWSFGDESEFGHARKITLFLMISIGAVVINTIIVRIITTEIHPFFSLDPRSWLIASKVIASIASALWNFTGYKIIVFKK